MSGIEFLGLSHYYELMPDGSPKYILKDIDQKWEDGKAYSLLGPSGSGKSTMLHLISGLLSPSVGNINFDGKSVLNLGVRERKVAQVFQFPVVYETLTVEENMAFPLLNMKYSQKFIQDRITYVAGLLDLGYLLKARSGDLTVAEKQLVALARGIVRPEVSAVILDEPLTVIDQKRKWEIRGMLKMLQKKSGLTMIYVTHDQAEALAFADYVSIIYEGKIIQHGTGIDLFEKPEHRFAGYFVGSPGMNFIPVEIEKDSFFLGNQRLSIDKYANYDFKGTKLELGIRPEYLRVVSPEQGDIKGKVLNAVDMGSYFQYEIKLENFVVFGRSHYYSSKLEISDFVGLKIDMQRAYIYCDDYLVQ